MTKKNNTMDIKNIIFDLGGVLIDWNPDYVFLNEFRGDEKKLKVFYEKVCTFEWNENQDAGYPIDRATEDRVNLFPEYEDQIRMYYGRWEEMIGGEIKEVVTILKSIVKECIKEIYTLSMCNLLFGGDLSSVANVATILSTKINTLYKL